MKKRIKELRLQNNLTLKEVATYLGVSEATAQRYETGGIENLKYDKVVMLASLFRCEPAYILGYDVEKKIDSSELDNQETKLLDLYRGLNDEGKYELMKQARLLNSVDIYKNECDISEELEA